MPAVAGAERPSGVRPGTAVIRLSEGGTTPSDRPELSSMADGYARYALSQRAAFEATHPSALDAAQLFADEPVGLQPGLSASASAKLTIRSSIIFGN